MERWRGQHHVGLEDSPTWSIVIDLQLLYPACSSPYSSFYQNPYLLLLIILLIPYIYCHSIRVIRHSSAEPWIGFRPECESSVAFLARFARLGKWWTGSTRYPRKEDGKWWTSRPCPRKNLSHTYHKKDSTNFTWNRTSDQAIPREFQAIAARFHLKFGMEKKSNFSKMEILEKSRAPCVSFSGVDELR